MGKVKSGFKAAIVLGLSLPLTSAAHFPSISPICTADGTDYKSIRDDLWNCLRADGITLMTSGAFEYKSNKVTMLDSTIDSYFGDPVVEDAANKKSGGRFNAFAFPDRTLIIGTMPEKAAEISKRYKFTPASISTIFLLHEGGHAHNFNISKVSAGRHANERERHADMAAILAINVYNTTPQTIELANRLVNYRSKTTIPTDRHATEGSIQFIIKQMQQPDWQRPQSIGVAYRMADAYFPLDLKRRQSKNKTIRAIPFNIISEQAFWPKAPARAASSPAPKAS